MTDYHYTAPESKSCPDCASKDRQIDRLEKDLKTGENEFNAMKSRIERIEQATSDDLAKLVLEASHAPGYAVESWEMSSAASKKRYRRIGTHVRDALLKLEAK